MQFNRGTEYAIRAVIYLAGHQEDTPILLEQIAERIDAPRNYLSNIFQTLTRFGLLQSHRGSRRGFSLARAPRDITLLQVVEALEGPFNLVCCMDDPSLCPVTSDCLLPSVLNDLRGVIRKKLGSCTLAKMVRRGEQLEAGRGAKKS